MGTLLNAPRYYTYAMKKRSERSLSIVFTNLTRYTAQSLRVSDREIADTMDQYYEHTGKAVAGAGGTVVKFIGDGALLLFPEGRVDRGVSMLFSLKRSVDQLMEKRNWEPRLAAKVHFGRVVVGEFGSRGEKRFDILGKEVNAAARMRSNGITLSESAFRKLGARLRKQFQKNAPPITYLSGD